MEGAASFFGPIEIPDDSFQTMDRNDKMSPVYRRPGSLYGYSGHYSGVHGQVHELEIPNTKTMIRGYTGHRSQRNFVVGEPIVPSLDKQSVLYSPDKSRALLGTNSKDKDELRSPTAQTDQLLLNFRSFAKHMDTLERYHTAVEHLIERGQSQEMLLRIVQAKMSQRVNSFSAQLISTRKLFEAFDLNKDGVLDESEFRIILEKLNIQFDDVQVLALFAYFDIDNDGFVEWKDFADHAMVQNPRGGTAVLPKMITAVAKTKHTDLHSIKDHPYYSKSSR